MNCHNVLWHTAWCSRTKATNRTQYDIFDSNHDCLSHYSFDCWCLSQLWTRLFLDSRQVAFMGIKCYSICYTPHATRRSDNLKFLCPGNKFLFFDIYSSFIVFNFFNRFSSMIRFKLLIMMTYDITFFSLTLYFTIHITRAI